MTQIPEGRKMQRCCRCSAMMPADRVESDPADRSKLIYTKYTCECMVNVVRLKNIGPENADAFFVSQPQGGDS